MLQVNPSPPRVVRSPCQALRINLTRDPPCQQGITNIRAFRRTDDFRQAHFDKVDTNSSLFMLFWLSARWLAIRLDVLAVLVMLVLSALAVAVCELRVFDAISPSLLGLGLVYSLQCTGLLQWTVRLVVEAGELLAMTAAHFKREPGTSDGASPVLAPQRTT
jgi:hypothetical protein